MSEENLYGLPPKKIMELRKSQKINDDLANSLIRSSGSDPRRDKPRFTTFEIAEYVCGWLLDDQCLHTVEDAEMAIGNALGQLRCGQDGLLASKQGRSRNFLSQNTPSGSVLCLLNHADDLLESVEDTVKGEEGDKVTEARGHIAKCLDLITQNTKM